MLTGLQVARAAREAQEAEGVPGAVGRGHPKARRGCVGSSGGGGVVVESLDTLEESKKSFGSEFRFSYYAYEARRHTKARARGHHAVTRGVSVVDARAGTRVRAR